tara:strand:+ start:795 stop:989 length:195 start_codon:yes stop_codon:yes gene_type:complete
MKEILKSIYESLCDIIITTAIIIFVITISSLFIAGSMVYILAIMFITIMGAVATKLITKINLNK